MTEDTDISIRIADWDKDQETLRHIRQVVFIQEQAVTPEEEWEGDDHLYTHFLAYTHNTAIGTARVSITPEYAKIGRMAVLKQYRGKQIGRHLLEHAVAYARQQGAEKAILNAQVAAKDFYMKSGFIAEGEHFMEANIEHTRMIKVL